MAKDVSAEAALVAGPQQKACWKLSDLPPDDRAVQLPFGLDHLSLSKVGNLLQHSGTSTDVWPMRMVVFYGVNRREQGYGTA